MDDWNTVITLYEEPSAYRRARGLLRHMGAIAASGFHNVLVMHVDDVDDFLHAFSALCDAEPGILNDISRAVPLSDVFDFATAEEFENKARAIALSWSPRLAGHSFYVRLHRRGLKGTLRSPDEERFLDEALLSALETAGKPGKVRFEDPDFAINVETVGHRAGMALWSRKDLRKYKFLRVD